MLERYAVVLALALTLVAGASAPPASPRDRSGTGAAAELAYEIGGPLEGPRLPLMPTHNGEPAGFAGCIPELMNQGEESVDGSGSVYREWSPQDQWPIHRLYPGSVENWRGYWMKYVPVRSMVDQASLLKKWVAPEIPLAGGGGKASVEQYAAPVYWVPRFRDPRPTGKFTKPVPVLRTAPGTGFDLDLGELPIGLYVVRVIGVVGGEEGKQFYRKPLYLRLSVNDGPAGESSDYRMQAGYVDEFYSLAEFYFHAPAKREYRASLVVDEGTQAALLVQSIDLHDVLAGIVRRPIKQRMTLTTPDELQVLREQTAKPVKLAITIADAEKRRDLDMAIWQALPPLNAQLGGIYGENKERGGYHADVTFGFGGKTLKELEAEHGKWEMPRQALSPVLIENKKLKLQYTMADLAAHKPLPDPFPVKDRGLGLVTPAPGVARASTSRPAAGEPRPQYYTIVADAAAHRFNPFFQELRRNAQRYHETGDVEAGWSAAVQLVRTAWQYPTLDATQALGAVITRQAGFSTDRFYRRQAHIPVGTGNGIGSDQLLDFYDQVFEVIKGNQALADSVGRFVPWVKTPDDVIQLLDVYLVQYQAKRVIRYNFLYDNYPAWIAKPAAVLGDRSVTDPWMKWLFAKAYVYPNPPSGMADMLITGNDRDGIGYIGSWSYGLGEQAGKAGSYLDSYVRAGGDAKYDLSNPRSFPKVAQAAYFPLRSRIGGLNFPRIGDVAGPDKGYGYLFDSVAQAAPQGWRLTKDPQFAYVLKHVTGRKGQSDADWNEIEKTAAVVQRPPWMDSRSRVLVNWFGLLESGTQYDDFRFHRTVMLRVGQGHGHAHNDTLDLQITAHGLPMTVDGGQRVGYGKPGDSTTRLHNLVEVDGKQWLGHSWVRTLNDTDGARYMLAEAVPPANLPNVKFYRRQVALVDVDEGQGYQPLSVEQTRPGAKLPTGVVTPNSYVLDVVRVSGGKTHRYCFHGALEDELVSNAVDQKNYEFPALPLPKDQPVDPSVECISIFRNQPIEGYPMQPLHWKGRAPAVLEATWRMAVTIPRYGLGESQMAPGIWSPTNPRKYTKLHLLGQEGATVMTGWYWCRQWSYGMNNLYTQQHRDEDADVVFPAIIEPYSGKPFVTERKLVDVAANETDALRAVAVEVTTNNGHTDLLVADGRPEKVRKIGDIAVSGEFAALSRDSKGLRLANLSGGTELRASDVVIKTSGRERTAKVVRIGYEDKVMRIQPLASSVAWPTGAAAVAGRIIEIGSAQHQTTYTLSDATAASAAGEGLQQLELSTQGGADLSMARVLRVDAGKRQVLTSIGLPMLAGVPCPGFDRNLAATNQDGSKTWRAHYLGRSSDPFVKGYLFELDGPVSEADFAGANNGLRTWEYGVGDMLRQSTFASLVRISDGVFKLTADVGLSVSLRGESLESSVDGEQWAPAAGVERADGLVTVRVTQEQVWGTAMYLKVRP